MHLEIPRHILSNTLFFSYQEPTLVAMHGPYRSYIELVLDRGAKFSLYLHFSNAKRLCHSVGCSVARPLAGIPPIAQTRRLVLEVSRDLGISCCIVPRVPRALFRRWPWGRRAKGRHLDAYLPWRGSWIRVPQKSPFFNRQDTISRWLLSTRGPCTFRYNECITTRYQSAINRTWCVDEGTDMPRREYYRLAAVYRR